MVRKILQFIIVSFLFVQCTTLCASTQSRVYYGSASWYGPGFHGRRTANGERFDKNRSTLASRHLPFGTLVRVTCLKTGKSATARVNDRGPFVHGRIVDCSEGLAKKIGLKSLGVSRVKVEVLPKR